MRCDVTEYEGKGRPDGTSQQHARHEEQGWAHRPHEELVGAFRGLIWKERHRHGSRMASRFPPASIVRSALSEKTGRFAVPTEEKHKFFHEIREAFDAIAWEHYQWQPGELSAEQINARSYLSHRHFVAKRHQDPHPELIRLDPLQVRILDALAEAADVPHQRGRAEIEIPDHLRHEVEDHLRETFKERGWDQSTIFPGTGNKGTTGK
jgi:hypothetical protein